MVNVLIIWMNIAALVIFSHYIKLRLIKCNLLGVWNHSELVWTLSCPSQVILVLSTLSAPSDSFYEGGSTRLYRRSVVHFNPFSNNMELSLALLLISYATTIIGWCQSPKSLISPWFICLQDTFTCNQLGLSYWYVETFYSDDYGKSFHDISHAINNTFIKKDFGISAGPGNPQQVNKCPNLKSVAMALSLRKPLVKLVSTNSN